MKRMITMLLLATIFTFCLAGCGEKQPVSGGTPENSQSQASGTNPNKGNEAKQSTMVGIVNRLENPLVILDEKDQYLKFDVENVSLDGIEDGDQVEITYTGTLSEDSTDLVATAIVQK